MVPGKTVKSYQQSCLSMKNEPILQSVALFVFGNRPNENEKLKFSVRVKNRRREFRDAVKLLFCIFSLFHEFSVARNFCFVSSKTMLWLASVVVVTAFNHVFEGRGWKTFPSDPETRQWSSRIGITVLSTHLACVFLFGKLDNDDKHQKSMTKPSHRKAKWGEWTVV